MTSESDDKKIAELEILVFLQEAIVRMNAVQDLADEGIEHECLYSALLKSKQVIEDE